MSSEDTEKFVENLFRHITSKFNEEKQVHPAILVTKGDQIGIIPVGHLMSNKDLVAALLSKIRSTSEFVVFVTEVWMVNVAASEELEGMPSEHPDRVERVMMTTYEGKKVKMYMADIIRSGDWVELGKWERFDDQVGKLSGRFMDAPPDWN